MGLSSECFTTIITHHIFMLSIKKMRLWLTLQRWIFSKGNYPKGLELSLLNGQSSIEKINDQLEKSV